MFSHLCWIKYFETIKVCNVSFISPPWLWRLCSILTLLPHNECDYQEVTSEQQREECPVWAGYQWQRCLHPGKVTFYSCYYWWWWRSFLRHIFIFSFLENIIMRELTKARKIPTPRKMNVPPILFSASFELLTWTPNIFVFV